MGAETEAKLGLPRAKRDKKLGRLANEPYRNDQAQTLDRVPPLPYRDFEDTFR